MTSEERRAARRIRREEKRRKKKEAVNEKYGKLENVFDYGNLLEAFDKSKKGVRWKCSVQRYEASLLRKTYDTHMKLLKGEDIRRGFHRFEIYERMGITVNKKKTRIVALRRGFTFLKTKFTLSDTGKVIMRPCRKSITLERRKLKKLKKKLDEGTITFEEVRQQYQSWKGYMKHKQSWRTVQNMNQLFNELFIDSWKGKEEKKHEDQIQGQQQRIRRIRQENRTEYVACADRNKSKRSEHGRN